MSVCEDTSELLFTLMIYYNIEVESSIKENSLITKISYLERSTTRLIKTVYHKIESIGSILLGFHGWPTNHMHITNDKMLIGNSYFKIWMCLIGHVVKMQTDKANSKHTNLCVSAFQRSVSFRSSTAHSILLFLTMLLY